MEKKTKIERENLMVEKEPSESLTIFGENFKRLRANQKLTHRELMEKTGLTDTYLWAVENKGKNISINSAHKIAQALKVPLFVLLMPPD